MSTFLDRMRARLGRHSPLKLAIVSAVIGLFVGAVAFAGTVAGLSWTNTEKFCISCNEMKDNSLVEFKGTIHDTNRSGVRATCPDCHVPHELGPKLYRKFEATFELYGTMIGRVDTKEKFEQYRHEMAVREWKRMKASDSGTCRNCHSREAMSKDAQSEKAWSRHEKAKAEGKTCIDCHFGIAHHEPEGPGPREIFSKQAP